MLGVLIFVFYYVPSVRPHLGFWDPEGALRTAIVRYRDDDDLRDLIDIMQREVAYFLFLAHLPSRYTKRNKELTFSWPSYSLETI